VQLSSFTPAQRLWAISTVVGLLAVVGVVVTAAVLAGRTSAAADITIAIDGGVENCGKGWSDPRTGALTFTVKNTTIAGEEVYLQSATDGKVYGELEGIGPGASQRLQVVLGAGSYRFACLPEDNEPVAGPVVRVKGSGTVHGLTPGVALVTPNDLYPAAHSYETWIGSQLPVLLSDATSLDADVRSGNLGAAKRDWLAGHLVYESLGAAYGAFGDADTAINGDPAPGLGFMTDPDLTGFHRIEAGLWGGQTATALAPFTARLVSDVASLQQSFARTHVNVLDVGLRAHEILENAIQFEATGARDAGSHTSLATIGANLAGTEQALSPLHDILETRYPQLATAESWLTRSAGFVASLRQADGSWPAVDQLDRSRRATLDADLGRTVELLAPVAAICDPRSPAP
jgi:iron uptake system component EfeO